MKCPGCAMEMKLQRVISIEIDVCPSCNGIVLDKGEPEVIEALGVARIIEGSLNKTSHEASTIPTSGDIAAARRHPVATCYVCQKQMIALVGAGDVEYDWCDGCERLFFDRGELSALETFQAE